MRAIGADVLLSAGDPVLRVLLAQALRTAGHPVTAVAGPDEALACLRDGVRPQVLVLDGEPTATRGFVATARQLLPTPCAPIILLTADPMERTEALAGGVAACLAKPVDLAELATVVTRVGRPVAGAKDAALETIHLRRLRRLSGDVRRARDTLAVHRAALRELTMTAGHRPLTAEESALVGALRQAQAELRWELRLLRYEFESVQQTPKHRPSSDLVE